MRLDELSADALIQGRLAPLAVSQLSPDDARWAELRLHALRAAAADMAMSAELQAIIEVCDSPLLVIKGAANGLLYYPDSALRPRADIDVWLDGWEAAAALADSLVSLGYHRILQLPGRFCRHAIAMRRGDVSVDVHARCSRRERLAQALPFRLAWEERQPLAATGGFALSDRHAWLLLAAQLGAHHANQDILPIHLEDLRRIAENLSSADWETLMRIVETRELRSAVRGVVAALGDWSAGTVPNDFATAVETDDESAAFRHPVLAVLDDLEFMNLGEQQAYLTELLYPPHEFLTAQLGVARPRPRALLALHRALRLMRTTLSRRSSTGAA